MQIIQEAETSWRKLLAKLVGHMLHKEVELDTFYALRHPGPHPPKIWSARLRVPPDQAEPILGRSGLEGLFVRPAEGVVLQGQEGYTLIWGPRHDAAGPSELAKILQTLDSLPGHRGLARSLGGIGVRVPWTCVNTARRALRPHDPALSEETYSLRDQLLFKCAGTPLGTSMSEIAKLCRDIQWKAIPQARYNLKSGLVWFLTAEAPPKDMTFQLGGSLAFVEESSHEELREHRLGQYKKRNNALAEQDDSGPKQKATGADPLQKRDPWADWSLSSAKSNQQVPVQAKLTQSTSASSSALIADPRVDAVLSRLDNLEAKDTEVQGRLDKLDSAVETLGTSMSSQFSQVLQSLADLASMQDPEGSPSKRRTTEQVSH